MKMIYVVLHEKQAETKPTIEFLMEQIEKCDAELKAFNDKTMMRYEGVCYLYARRFLKLLWHLLKKGVEPAHCNEIGETVFELILSSIENETFIFTKTMWREDILLQCALIIESYDGYKILAELPIFKEFMKDLEPETNEE